MQPQPTTIRAGRPRKNFEECGVRSKRYKKRLIQATYSQEEINYAASAGNTSTYINTDKALALFVQAKLSKYQYEILRHAFKNEGHDILPPYYKILEAKQECYPKDIVITESSANVSLQNLLDHTTTRIFQCKTKEELNEINGESLTLFSKWGCDGASEQCEYKQKFSNPRVSDANLFMTSLVPLSMKNDKILWENKQPSSTRLCRCLKF